MIESDYGPYAEFVVPYREPKLSAAGRDYLTNWLTDYVLPGENTPSPGRLLARVFYGTFKHATEMGLDHDEINAICMVSLTSAMLKWKPEDGKFSTFAAWRMRSGIQHQMRRSGLPTDGTKVLSGGGSCSSRGDYDSPNDVLATLTDHSAPKPDVDILADVIEEGMRKSGLNDRSRAIVRKRFGMDGGEPLTLTAIGMKFGIGKERSRQILADAFCKLAPQLANWRSACREKA